MSLLRQTTPSESRDAPAGQLGSVVQQTDHHGSYASASLTTSLALLKDAAEMTAKVPYLKTVSGVLLRIIEVRDQIRFSNDRWAEIMENVTRVAHFVHDTSMYCERSETADLPGDLQHLLGSLARDLSAVENILHKCRGQSKWARFKQVVTRSEISKKIEECDRKIKTTLDACNTTLMLNIRTNQHAAEHQTLSIFLRIPAKPQVFYGREETLDLIISLIFSALDAPARISILGSGGMGKTSLALAILHQPSVQAKFQKAIYFVSCEGCTSVAALWAEMARNFKLAIDPNIGLDQMILSYLGSFAASILCLDNFETLWDQEVEQKIAVESFLARLAALHNTTLVLTMRGVERPAGIAWTQPILSPLQPLDTAAAKKTFQNISGQWDAWAEKLIEVVDGLPLAVTLLAHLAQSLPCRQLWQRWEQKHVAAIERNKGHRLTSLELSIQLSIEGSRMRSDPEILSVLSILCTLPGGLILNKTEQYETITKITDMIGKLLPLQQSSLVYITPDNVLQTHPLIRYYCQAHHPLSLTLRNVIEQYYIELALKQSDGKADIYKDKSLEIQNIGSILLDCLKDKSALAYPSLPEAVNIHGKFCASRGILAQPLFETINSQFHLLSIRQQTKIMNTWGHCFLETDNWEFAKQKFLEALDCSQRFKDDIGQGDAYYGLADVYVAEDKLDIAMEHFQKALKIHQQASHVQGQGKALTQIGSMLLLKNKVEEAESCLLASLKIHEEMNDSIGQANNLNTLGNLYLHKWLYNESIEYYNQALNLYEILNDSVYQGDVLTNLGQAHQLLGQYDYAEQLIQKALILQKEAKNERGKGYAIDCLAKVYLDQGKLDDALASYNAALDIHVRRNDKASQAQSLQGLGHVLKIPKIWMDKDLIVRFLVTPIIASIVWTWLEIIGEKG
ncbi:TPR-like protein [Artomyces pyxidatus]|uniref:TPR-like protein n=1 Tax=Artomyces pyxidatus TaxID=48021 RepID=A0ACB8SKY0_9AGAM|nr:TPR-like protein [Artomyces pyxidatus]